uniref:Uncharacterized protein n=1 Tax=Anguilla anguilla TaxID=7936 RepID=A0A0E9UVL1_ANGAN
MLTQLLSSLHSTQCATCVYTWFDIISLSLFPTWLVVVTVSLCELTVHC